MDNPGEITRLCRLCLVKDEVNIPIFDEQNDIRQIFLKISSCLPVKVSRDDKLPKKICDGCSCKLDLLYEFWNTSANSEKTLLSWLGQAGVKKTDADHKLSAVVQQVANKPETLVKQEAVDPNDGHPPQQASDDSMLLNFQEKFSYEEDTDAGPSETTTKDETEAPPPKRARRTAAVKAQINITAESDDDEDMDNIEPMTKVEDESEESEGEDQEPSFADVPGTSTDDQPGPSGVGKDASLEAPLPRKRKRKPARSRNKKIEEVVKTEVSISDSEDSPLSKYRIKVKQDLSQNPESLETLYCNLQTRKKKRSYKMDRVWTCKKCPQVFATYRKLKAHRKIHTNDISEKHTYKFDRDQDLYICNTCSAEYQDITEVQMHLKIHENQYRCSDCEATFKTAYHLGCHLAVHSETGEVSCPLCSYKSPKKGALLIHINYVHLRKFAYVCQACGKGFNDHLLYKEHGNEHLGLRPFTCVVCSKTFTYTRYLYTHQVRAHRVGIDGQLLPNQCHHCSKKYSKPESLEKHLEVTHYNTGPREKKHLCDTCGKGFAQRSKLVIHERVHTGYKPYECSYCEKSFTKKDYLVMHERVHSGEKPYSCGYCGKCFSQAAPLRIHLRTHTGEKPYVCQFCNTGFTSRGALNIHCKNCTRGTVVC